MGARIWGRINQSMTSSPTLKPQPSLTHRRGLYIAAGLAGALIAAIALDTTVVPIGGENDMRQAAFSPDAFGEKEFPRIQAYVNGRAVDALQLAPAVLADKAAAAKQYGTPSSTGAIMMVRATGVVGDGTSGIYDVAVEGLPPEIRVRMQSGPAVNGTDLRDAPGDIAFGQFKNQIEFQNAASGINRAMKKAVLDKVDAGALKGKTVDLVGAFRLVNPKSWLITPVAVTVK
jgi:predicted lipoprotein